MCSQFDFDVIVAYYSNSKYVQEKIMQLLISNPYNESMFSMCKMS